MTEPDVPTGEPRDEAQEIAERACKMTWISRDGLPQCDDFAAEIRAYAERQRGTVHVCKEQVYMGEAAQYRGALDRIRELWPHIEIARPKHFLDRSVYDPGAPTCLRCKIEEVIGQQPTPTDDCPTCGYSAWGRRIWESNGARFCAVCEARQEKADALTAEQSALNERSQWEGSALHAESLLEEAARALTCEAHNVTRDQVPVVASDMHSACHISARIEAALQARAKRAEADLAAARGLIAAYALHQKQDMDALDAAQERIKRLEEAGRNLVAEYESHGGSGTHQECFPGCGCQMPQAVAQLRAALAEPEEG